MKFIGLGEGKGTVEGDVVVELQHHEQTVEDDGIIGIIHASRNVNFLQ
jgi:hypothetical protein